MRVATLSKAFLVISKNSHFTFLFCTLISLVPVSVNASTATDDWSNAEYFIVNDDFGPVYDLKVDATLNEVKETPISAFRFPFVPYDIIATKKNTPIFNEIANNNKIYNSLVDEVKEIPISAFKFPFVPYDIIAANKNTPVFNEIANNNKIYNSLVICTNGSQDPICNNHWQDLNCTGCGSLSCEEPPDGNLNGSQAICPSTGQPPAYEWQFRNASNNWVWENASGVFWEDDYNPPSTSESTWYRRRTLCAGCTNWTETGEVVDVHVQPPLTSGGTINGNHCGPYPYTITTGQIQGMSSENLTQFIEFQWRRNCDGAGWEVLTNLNFLDVNDNSLISYTVTANAMIGHSSCLYEKRMRVHGCDTWVTTPSITLETDCCTIPDVSSDSYSACPGTNISGNVSTNDGSLTNPIYTLQSGGSASSNGSVNVNSNGTFTFDPSGTPCGNYSFTYRVCNNNDSSCCSDATVSLSYSDNTDPVLSGVPGNTTVSCNSIPSAASPSASDNCDTNVSITMNQTTSGTICTDSYTITRTWTATDNCGNTDVESQVITVRDTTDPVLSGVPGNVTVQCNAIPSAASPTATDNCDTNVSITMNQTTSGTICTDSYTITRTWTATDNCGNTDVESQVITVRDTSDPVLSGVPSNVTVGCDAVPSAASPSASDNCDTSVGVTMNESTAAGACSDTYTVTRTWTATDNCGNTDVESQVITVQNTPDPTPVGDERCGPGVVNLSASSTGSCVSCDAIRWYSALTGGAVINTGSTYAPSITATTSYYVTCYNASINCESSPRQAVVGTMNATPTIVANATCSGVGLTYSITVTTTAATVLMSSQGTVSGSAPNFTVSGVTTGVNAVLVAMNNTTSCNMMQTVQSPTCACPAGSPTVTGDEICGPGSVTLSASSGANCDEIRWYSAATGGAAINTGTTYAPSITATTSYFVACYNAANDCESDPRQEVIATMNPAPTFTTAMSQGTCNGTTANNDAVINLTSVVGDEANIMTGATYTPGADYGNATNTDVSGGTGSFAGLMHNTQYTLRVWNGSSDCFEDVTITTPSINCSASCTNPTYTATTAQGTCTGTTANNDATLNLSSVSNGDEANISAGSTYTGVAYGAAANTDVSGGTGSFTGLMHATAYTVRVWNGADDCYVDETVMTPSIDCTAATTLCGCTEYVYMADIGYEGGVQGGRMHKWQVNSDGTLIPEIVNPDPSGNSWYPGGAGYDQTEFTSPHGVVQDLNGFLYVGETDGGDIRKLTCDGDVLPESEFVINTGGYNFGAIGNELFFSGLGGAKQFVRSYSMCDGSFLRQACLNDVTGFRNWGLYVSPQNDTIYVTNDNGNIYKLTMDDFGTNVCIDPIANVPHIGTAGNHMHGITADLDGNMYVVSLANEKVYKLSASGVMLDSITVSEQAHGIYYSPTADRLYTSFTTYNNGSPCLASIDKDLTQITTIITADGIGAGKAITGLFECCPNVSPLVFDEVVCSNGTGEKVFLQDVLSCGEGAVCGGVWSEIANSSNGSIVFDDCDLSIVVNGTGCATYELSNSDPTSQCGAYDITVNICTEVPTATLTPSVGTCTASNPNNDATIDITAVMNADAANFSTGATYTGPAYGGAGEVEISSGSGSIIGLMHNTQYTVRVWNGEDGCFVDETVMTPSIDCDSCPDLTCSSIFVSGTEISGTPLTTAGPNLIFNPSFESEPLNFNTYGDLPDFQADIDGADMIDWVTFNTVFPPGRIVDESISGFPPGYYDVQEGEYAFIGFSWDNASQITGVRQDIQVESGVEYCASFYMAPGGKYSTSLNAWIEYPLSGEGHGWGVTLSGAASYNQDYLADTDDFDSGSTINPIEWTLHEFSFVATSTGTVTVEFAMLEIAGRKAIYLDNVSITACGSAEPCASPGCDPVPSYEVCSDGSNNVTLSCDNANVNTIIWYDSNGVQVGTSCDLILDNSDIGDGTAGQTECFYYEALDANGCDLISCCPVTVQVTDCTEPCPDPNCFNISVQQNE